MTDLNLRNLKDGNNGGRFSEILSFAKCLQDHLSISNFFFLFGAANKLLMDFFEINVEKFSNFRWFFS
ncbi:hypothetical protein, partial [Parasutterella excrementihominis]